MNKEHIDQLAKDFSGDYDCMNNNDAIVFAIKFIEHLIEKGELVSKDKYADLQHKFTEAMNHRAYWKEKAETPAKVISDTPKVDTDKCEKCGGRTALISGQWCHEMDSEPYMSGEKIDDKDRKTGEDWIHGFKCDDCGHLQGIWDEG